jgi:hypothetical protein
MINFDLTKDTNDIQVDADGNFLTTKTRIKDISQLLINRLQTFLGEVPTNLDKGVDYHGIVFSEFLTEQSKINEIVRVIIETDGVIGLEDFSFSSEKQVTSYDFVIKTDAGDIKFNELLQ